MSQGFELEQKESQNKDPLPRVQRITFHTQAVERGFIPAFSGHVVRGVLSQLLGKADKSLGDFLHEQNDRRPYAIKNVVVRDYDDRRKSRRTGDYRINAGELFSFTVVTLGSGFTQRVVDTLFKNEEPTIQFQAVPAIIHSVELNTVPLFEIEQSAAEGKYSVEFEMPTQFQTKEGGLMLFPELGKVFRFLGETWNALLPHHQIDLENTVYNAGKSSYVRAYHLQTREVDLGKSGRQVGFKGWMQVIIKPNEDQGLRWLPKLLKFGEIMNVGRYRTAGMGQMTCKKRNSETLAK